MHVLPTKPGGNPSAQDQAVTNSNNNNNRGRGRGNKRNNKRGNNANNNNNNRGNSNNRGNNNNNHGNSNNRGGGNNNDNRGNNNNSRGNRGGNSRGRGNRGGNSRGRGNRGGSKRGRPNNNSNDNRNGNHDDEWEEEEKSSTYSTDDQSYQSSENSDDFSDFKPQFLAPVGFNDFDERGERYIWHGPAPVCSSKSAYKSSPFKLDHTFAAWQRFDEHFDMPWPPPFKFKYKIFDVDKVTEALTAMELDIKRWETVLMDLWQPHVFENSDRFLVVLWVITRLQYLRALYPVMDANKYDYDIKAYFNYAVRFMNTKGPDCTAVVDFMSRQKENDQGDYSAYFDRWFKSNSTFGNFAKWNKGTQNSATKHNIETLEDTPVHKKAKTETTSTVLSSPPIQGAGFTPATKRQPVAVHATLPHPFAAATAPSIQPPLVPQLTRPQPFVPPPQSTLKPQMHHATSLPPTTTHPTPPPKLTHQLPQKPQTTALHVTQAQMILPKAAHHQPLANQPMRTSPQNIPPQTTSAQLTATHLITSLPTLPKSAQHQRHQTTAPQPTRTSPRNIPSLHITPGQTTAMHPAAAVQPTRTSPRNIPSQATAAQSTATQPAEAAATQPTTIPPQPSANSSKIEVTATRKRLEEVVALWDKEDMYFAATPIPKPTLTPAVNQSPSSPALREVEKDHHAHYPSPPVTSVYQKQQHQPSPSKKVDISPVSPASQSNPSTEPTYQEQPLQSPPNESNQAVLDMVDTGKHVRASDSLDWLEGTSMDLEPDVAHPSQQQQLIKSSGDCMLMKKVAEKIIDASTDLNASQDPSPVSMVSQPNMVIALGPQDHHHLQPQMDLTSGATMTTTTTTTTAAITDMMAAEVNIPSLIQGIKSWMETESRNQSALLQHLIVRNTLLETKVEEHTTRMEDELKKQEAYRSKTIAAAAAAAVTTGSQSTHSWNQELAFLQKRTLTQDLKISQLETQLESRIRHSLEQDLTVVRNELQEERVDNLTKDLEIKRAEAVDAMAKARAEMRDARQMVAEAREERANAMERAARAEADNQMLLRVINELQGTGWRISSGHGQAQAQGQVQAPGRGRVQDTGIHHMGSSSSVHPRSRIDYLHHPFTSTPLGAVGPSSTFMRFGTSMQQSFSSSSTESLPERVAAGAEPGGVDPSIHRMEFISVKLENDFISRLSVDPDLTEDDDNRTDTDHEATDEE